MFPLSPPAGILRHARRVRHPAAWTACACVAVAMALVLASCARRPPPARHLIVISMDTARADHFGFLGNRVVRTPRLDAFAGESIVFEDCMTAAPTTLASHTSLFTGNYPLHHGVPRNGFMVNRDNRMLPELLKPAGFHTAGFAGSFALDTLFDFAQGFDHYDEDFSVYVGEGGADQNQRDASQVTDAVIRYLDGIETPERLFLFVHYFDPHQPYAAPAPFDTMYDPRGRAGIPTMHELKLSTDMPVAVRDRITARISMQYAGEISYLDGQIGRLLDDLGRRGILDDAMVVLTSDHGENLVDHPVRFDHGYNLYQSTLHAVCVMRLPHGAHGGTRRHRLFSNVDVLPTVLGYVGIAAPRGIDGEAVDLLAPEPAGPDPARYGQATKPWQGIETDPRWTNMLKTRCIREGRFKFIQSPWRDGLEEMYDLVADPGEQDDLLQHPTLDVTERAAALRGKLETWAASADPLPSRFEQAQQEETIRRLKSLGYIN